MNRRAHLTLENTNRGSGMLRGIAAALACAVLLTTGCRQVVIRHEPPGRPAPEPSPPETPPPVAPVVKPETPAPEGGYVIQKGDTLWSIASQFGLESWRQILEANPGISDPKDLRPGMRLRIPKGGERAAPDPSAPPAPTRLLPTPHVPGGPKEGRFVWPAKGPVLVRYGGSMPGDPRTICRGIVIGVRPNTPVRAAKSGVAFVMESVPGLGRTVAVDHGDGSVTTYAMNDRIAVKYGEYVRQGETLAYAGSGSGRIFFRLDVNRGPADPLRHLPR